GAAIAISGFVEALDSDFLNNPWIDLNIAAERDWLKDDLTRSNANVFGQPVIIGVRKGFPNFNKAVLQSVAQISRRLQLRRPSTLTPVSVTNQAHVISITNLWAVEAWSSYTQAFSRAVELRASIRSAV